MQDAGITISNTDLKRLLACARSSARSLLVMFLPHSIVLFRVGCIGRLDRQCHELNTALQWQVECMAARKLRGNLLPFLTGDRISETFSSAFRKIFVLCLPTESSHFVTHS